MDAVAKPPLHPFVSPFSLVFLITGGAQMLPKPSRPLWADSLDHLFCRQAFSLERTGLTGSRTPGEER